MDDNSTLAGMTIEVSRNDGFFEGRIISMPPNAGAFEVGQLKWYQIKKVGFGKYECYDLSYDYIRDVYYYTEFPVTNTVLFGGNKLTSYNKEVELGKYQVWVKQK